MKYAISKESQSGPNQQMDSSATIVNPLDPGKWLIQDPGRKFFLYTTKPCRSNTSY
jgi:hypothetical protein